uniref:hypothetical protein n=1 Tax=Pannonibacter phragmitetus TaxID=121719 RepID=UPI000B9663DC|nr:hypothetical protein [Pannonibacter phragmitetus]
MSITRIYPEMGTCIFGSEQWTGTIDDVEQDTSSDMGCSGFGQLSTNLLCVDMWTVIVTTRH